MTVSLYLDILYRLIQFSFVDMSLSLSHSFHSNSDIPKSPLWSLGFDSKVSSGTASDLGAHCGKMGTSGFMTPGYLRISHPGLSCGCGAWKLRQNLKSSKVIHFSAASLPLLPRCTRKHWAKNPRRMVRIVSHLAMAGGKHLGFLRKKTVVVEQSLNTWKKDRLGSECFVYQS